MGIIDGLVTSGDNAGSPVFKKDDSFLSINMVDRNLSFPAGGDHQNGSSQNHQGTNQAKQGEGFGCDPGNLHLRKNGHGNKSDDGIECNDHTDPGGLCEFDGHGQ